MKGSEQGKEWANGKLQRIYGALQSVDPETGCCWGRSMRNIPGQTSGPYVGDTCLSSLLFPIPPSFPP